MSKLDKGGRTGWVSQYPTESSAGSSNAAGSSSSRPPAITESSNAAAPKYPSGYTPSSSPALSVPAQAQSRPSEGHATAATAQQRTNIPAVNDSTAAPVRQALAATIAPGPLEEQIGVRATPKPTPTPAARVRALHKFEPTEPSELGFEKGDVIKVVDRGYKDWWRGVLRGKTGIFPVNYVVSVFSDPHSECQLELFYRKSSQNRRKPRSSRRHNKKPISLLKLLPLTNC